MRHNSRHLARRNAVQALYQWDITGQSVDEIENAFINDDAFVGVQRSYFQHLIENVPRQCEVLDGRLKQCISRELDSIDPVERAILRLSTYELLFRPDIPAKVVLNEAIELSRVFGSEEGFRFVNGVLDALVNKKPVEEIRSE
ncbi:MAG TPA: transcription antitermination factor NusB [Gammaproteobacteria bacterium]|jgi:N utilization substance protein B|nr:transcription antitermination factor NusB [Gammaproteobacteria bacterium]|tara:strand:- start:329 stop:757 length:429 start_codon:yes stop_codon:yes gene_type:complete